MSEQMMVDSEQFVIFKLGKEEYGIDIHMVTTIERMMHITRVPKTAEFVKGVMSLRGEIVPVIDLRKRFNMPRVEETEDTRIIIFKVEDVILGMVVDEVTEVISIPVDKVENIGSITNDHMANYIYGVGKLEDRIITLLNLESLIENYQDFS